MMRARLVLLAFIAALACLPRPADAVYQCGNQKDTCNCGMANPYPCCDNGGNCTWWAWEAACCNWGVGLPGWGNANTWASYANQNGNYQVLGSPVVGAIATSTKGGYGHVAYVTAVNGGTIQVTEENCCGTCNYGLRSATYYTSYFNSGFIVKKGAPPPGPVCNNGKCEGGENCANCPGDCGSCCGNGACDNGENCASCPNDCGACCGNGQCAGGENCSNCSQDCGACCGNGACDYGETCNSCDKDCGVCCGNGTCDFGETCDSCSQDCGLCCGNGVCDYGENCKECSKDCGDCCGNGLCDYGETCDICAKDCGACCGDGECNYGETCDSCSQDCGACCGNGLCDFGESCASCSQDCICLPTGGLEAATCAAISGWALDTDPKATVTVRIRIGGEIAATLQANGPLHAGHSFSWPVPTALKQGKPVVVTVEAQDVESAGVTTFGPHTFLCDNATTHEGIWTTTRQDEAGVEVSLPAQPGPAQLALRHQHPLESPYPIDGLLETCTRPGVEAFDGLSAKAVWALSGGPLRSTLLIDGQPVRVWEQADGNDDAIATGGGEVVCLRTEALASTMVAKQATVDVGQLTLQTGAWHYSYSAQAAGLTLSRPVDDTLRVRARLDAGQPVVGRGQLRVWHDFGQPFDAVAYAFEAKNNSGALPELTAGKTTWVVQPGTQVRHALDAQALEWRVRIPSEMELPADLSLELGKLRVSRSDVAAAGPWQVARQQAWGFAAQVPQGAQPDARGLAMDLRHVPPGWWSTGQALATVGVTGAPFERMRATLQSQAAGPGVRLRVATDAQGLLSSLDLAQVPGKLDLTVQGHVLTLAIGTDLDVADLPASAVQVSGLEFLRSGWWTALSPLCVGLRDDRLPEDGVRLENVQLWGQLGFGAAGVDVVHRDWPAAWQGVRFHYRQDMHPAALQVSVQFDGKQVKAFDEDGSAEKDVEVAGSFQDLAFALTAKDGLPHDAPWFAEFTKIEVQGADGKWQPAVERVTPPDPNAPDAVAQADAGADAGESPDVALSPDAPSLPDALVQDVPAAVKTVQSGAASGSCQAAPTTGKGAVPLLVLGLALALLAVRRRSLRQP